jgi:hypothetical protein
MWTPVWTKADASGLYTAIHSANVDNPLGRASPVSRSPSDGSIGDNRSHARNYPYTDSICVDNFY